MLFQALPAAPPPVSFLRAAQDLELAAEAVGRTNSATTIVTAKEQAQLRGPAAHGLHPMASTGWLACAPHASESAQMSAQAHGGELRV